MNDRKEVEKQFLKNTENHTMKIHKDDGLYRYLEFSKNGSSVYRYDIHTWPGYMCVSGDMGSWVFQRLEDMFRFFRHDNINPGYWAEKLQACPKTGYEEFSREKAIEALKNDIEDMDLEEEHKRQAWNEIEDCLIHHMEDGYHCFMQKAYDFNSMYDFGWSFGDFYEYDLMDYTWHYLWICWAIVHGIKAYDKEKLCP